MAPLTALHVAIYWAAFAAAIAAIGPVAAAIRDPWLQRIFSGTLLSVAMLAVTYVFARRNWTTLSESGIGLDRATPARFALGLLLGLVLLLVPVSVVAIVDGVRWVPDPKADFAAVLPALCAYIALSCIEELGFRAFPLLGTHRKLGLWRAQTVVALAFILYHIIGGQPWISAVIGTGLGSVLFGMAAVATRGLALPIGLHAMWNFGTWALGDKGGNGLWTPVHTGSQSMAGQFAYVGAFCAWALGFWLWTRRRASVCRTDYLEPLAPLGEAHPGSDTVAR